MAWSPAERQVRYRQKKYQQLEKLPKVECTCGCGELIPIINKLGGLAKYKHGHNPDGFNTRFRKGRETWNKGIKGKAPHSYINGKGYAPYQGSFSKRFRCLIRERDNNQCQICGITERDYGRTLCVHHIDHSKDNQNLANLVTVCQKCNVLASRERKLKLHELAALRR